MIADGCPKRSVTQKKIMLRTQIENALDIAKLGISSDTAKFMGSQTDKMLRLADELYPRVELDSFVTYDWEAPLGNRYISVL